MSTFIIAEAGVNHNGSFDCAIQLANAAKAAGADAIKFQTFRADGLVTPDASAAAYQKANMGEVKSQYEMLKALELNEREFIELAHYCRSIGIEFCTTTFDKQSTVFALEKLDLRFIKIPSGEITNLPFLELVGTTGLPVILSTGMSEMHEVFNAVAALKRAGSKSITVLQCTSQYPAPFDEVNLRAMKEMGEILELPFGYSDHTLGAEVAIAAVALGAAVIEKHLTLDRSMVGPDHKASIEPEELRSMISQIRNVELALGEKEKTISAAEFENRSVVRKSIVAKNLINPGDVFGEDNLEIKRPGSGISPMEWHNVIGTRAKRKFLPNEMIEI